MRKEKRKGRQKRGRGEVEANCIGRAKLGIDLLAIHPSSKGQSGDVSHANLEPDWRVCTQNMYTETSMQTLPHPHTPPHTHTHTQAIILS